jgi:hypothetical protein
MPVPTMANFFSGSCGDFFGMRRSFLFPNEGEGLNGHCLRGGGLQPRIEAGFWPEIAAGKPLPQNKVSAKKSPAGAGLFS